MVVAVDDPTAGMGIVVVDGNGDGTFNSATLYPATAGASVAPLPADVRIADIDGDGNLDVAFTNSGEGTVGVLYGTGHWGTGESPFYAPIEYAANESPANLLLADVNGDGAVDAVVGGFNYLGLTALFNTGGNQVTLSSDSGAQEVRGPERASLVARAHAAPGDFTFTATVAPVNLAGAGPRGFPSGTVTFSDGDVVIGTGTLSGGTTSVTSNISTAGTHVITAQYSGDSNNAGLTRGVFIQAVDPSAPSYMLSASTNSATLEPGQSATFVVTVSPDPTSTDVVNFACGNLPQGVSCSFAPSSVTLNGSTPVSTTLTVSAAPGLRAVASSRDPDRTAGLPLQGLTFGAFGCVVLACFRRQTLKKFAVIPLLIILTVVLTLVGCSGNIIAPTQSSSPVATTIHVTATSAQKKASARLDFQITIRP